MLRQMGGGRERVRMQPDEISDFLDDAMKVQVATVNADGSPHLTTLFYVRRGSRLCFWTYARSQKIRNLERDPRISCLVEDGEQYFELRGVSFSGTARLVRDPEDVRLIGRAVVSRMSAGLDLGTAGDEEVERQLPRRVGVEVTAEAVASWDHRKMLD
jgi:PPOX class probable F420-dependent enzyme